MIKFFTRKGIETGTISWSKVAWLLIALVCFWHLFAVRLNGDNWKYAIASDGAGYYAYLPATFIYHDLTYQFAEEKSATYQSYPGCDVHFFGNKNPEGKRVNKYFIGTSILQAPFFLVAYFLSTVFDYPFGGYSFLFQAFICLAAIFYLLAGLHCMRKLLLAMKFNDTTVMMVMLLIFFGTNLYHYALEEPSMSHVYSFGLISFFLLNVFNLRATYSGRRIILLVITFTLIVLVRPTNAIILLLVFYFVNRGGFGMLFKEIWRDKKTMIISICIPLFLLFLQALSWKLSGGHWKEDTYVGESLNLLKPNIWEVLFSWRKGLFIYTPILLLSVIGLFFMSPRSKTFVMISFFLFNALVISSWHDWSYGGSFGMRPFVDSYTVCAIPLAFCINGIRNAFAGLSIALVSTFFVFLNLFQVYQYHQAILPYDSMTWAKYKRIFLKSNKVFAGIYPPGADYSGMVPAESRLLKTFTRNFDTDEYANQFAVVQNEKFISSPGSARLDEKSKFSADLFVPVVWGITDSAAGSFWIEAKAKIWLDKDATDAKMVIAFKDEKNNYEWNGFYVVHRVGKTRSWEEYSIAIPLPEIHSPTEIVSIYVLKEDDKLLYVDDLEISFWKVPAEKQ
ncbi:MAG: hypothetical protein M3R17_09175 [Bacteroidota bacterium]|nr:hypothetical protein [Bacteroidota bacterium]